MNKRTAGRLFLKSTIKFLFLPQIYGDRKKEREEEEEKRGKRRRKTEENREFCLGNGDYIISPFSRLRNVKQTLNCGNELWPGFTQYWLLNVDLN